MEFWIILIKLCINILGIWGGVTIEDLKQALEALEG